MKRYYVSLCELEPHAHAEEGGYTVEIPYYTTETFKRKSQMELFLNEVLDYYGGMVGDGWRIVCGKGLPPKNKPYCGYC